MPSTASRRRKAAKPHNSTTAEQPTPDSDIHTVATTTTQRGSQSHRHTLHVAAVVVLALVVYSNTLPNGFVFDDNVAIVGNNDVTGKGETNYTAIFTHDFWGEDIHSPKSHKSYRPLTVLTFRWNHLLAGEQGGTTGYHLVNLALHGLCTAAVYAVCRLCTKSPHAVAVAAAALFAVHPVHTEAVTGIVGRADVLCACLSLAAFALLGASSSSWLALVAALTVVSVAFFCKETAITMLGVFVVHEALRATSTTTGRKRWAIAARMLAIVCTGVALLSVRLLLTRNASSEAPGGFVLAGFRKIDNPLPFLDTVTERVLTTLYMYCVYTRLLVFPLHLSADYSFSAVAPVASLSDTRVGAILALGLATVAGVAALCRVLLRRPSQQRAVWLHSVAITILPFLPAAQIVFYPGLFIAERVLYLPSVGICIAVAHLVRAASKFQQMRV